ncbi:WD40 repeat-like protein [Neolentinus lepideus HHB14362 ss-1]|uniref:WD40 repeat-like protein n=1 Tax=Neolentinus lepideus HHB14362 ss-1 TaxID=1314782 RepID=A0A165TPB4_9AGAM|nr:WD40 repeat-like protein [Neolentinus lepideus HHB14362 ss-1]
MDRPIRPGKEPDKKTGNGVSAVCPLRHSGDFATGGHDHSVHLWSLRDVTSLRYSTPTLLSINHTSMIQSLLAIRDTSHKLVSAGADCAVRMWDMSSERVVRSFKVSNSVYHVHELENPFCTLLEVAHRDQQFEIHDHRLVPEKPVQRFGYASIHTHGRYIKGDIQSSNFACGDREGSIHLWDLRNTQATALSMSCFPGCKVVQVTFSSRERLTACSEDSEITTLDLGTGNS